MPEPEDTEPTGDSGTTSPEPSAPEPVPMTPNLDELNDHETRSADHDRDKLIR